MNKAQLDRVLKVFNRPLTRNAAGFYEGLRDQPATEPTAPKTKIPHAQYLFQSRLGAQVYKVIRESPLARTYSMGSFASEVEYILQGLQLQGSEVVLDIPCGHGNFGEQIAKALPNGVLICVDLSAAMLELARARHEKAKLTNVVYVQASALDLPFQDGAFDAVSACGGLHLYPDVDRAIAEMARVTRANGRVAGLTFSKRRILNVLRPAEELAEDLIGIRRFHGPDLGVQFANHGLSQWQWRDSAHFGYFQARVS